MKRTLLFLVMLLFILITLTGALYLFNQNQQKGGVSVGLIYYSLEVKFNGIKPDIQKSYLLNTTLTVYNLTILDNNVTIKVYPNLGYFVTSIDGVFNNINRSNAFWIYYLNNVRGSLAVDQMVPVNNTVISWRYE